MDLVRQSAVVRIDVETGGKGVWRITGEVQGTQYEPYSLSVSLVLAPNGQVRAWSGDCTCPVGEDCKHAVALTLKAQDVRPAQGRAPRSPQSAQALQAIQERVAAQARAEAEARLVRWLNEWDLVADDAAQAQTGARAQRPECYLYLLSTKGRLRNGAPQLQIEAVVSYPKLTGGWAKPKVVRTQPGPGQAVYDRATDADRQLLQLLRAMPRSLGYYSAYSGAPSGVLEGTVGLLALQQCLGQLEQAARAGDAQACAQHLDALPDLWQALRAAQSQLPAPALAAHTAPRHEPAPTAQLPALATPQHSQVLLALEDALLALEEGALPEPALLTLATLLPAAVLQPIQEAVERFDFPLAQQRLQALRHQL